MSTTQLLSPSLTTSMDAGSHWLTVSRKQPMSCWLEKLLWLLDMEMLVKDPLNLFVDLDVMLAGKVAMVAGYGDVGKGS